MALVWPVLSALQEYDMMYRNVEEDKGQAHKFKSLLFTATPRGTWVVMS